MELKECNRDTAVSGVRLEPAGAGYGSGSGAASIADFTGTISGLVGTPYEGGSFRIDIKLPSGYPFEPSKMKFVTKEDEPNRPTGARERDVSEDNGVLQWQQIYDEAVQDSKVHQQS